MATVRKVFQVNQKPARVWDHIADLGGVHRLFSFLASSKVEEGSRVCRTQEGDAIEERIYSVDAEAQRLAYTIVRSPFGFEAHAASWEVRDRDGSAEVHFLIDVLPDEAAVMLDGMLEQERPNIVAALS